MSSSGYERKLNVEGDRARKAVNNVLWGRGWNANVEMLHVCSSLPSLVVESWHSAACKLGSNIMK